VPTSGSKTCLAATSEVGTWQMHSFCKSRSYAQTTDVDCTLPCISIFTTYTKFVWKNKMLTLGVHLPQPCSSWPQLCRDKITFTVLPTNCFVTTTTNSMTYVKNWIPLRICVGSRNAQPHLNKLHSPIHKFPSLCIDFGGRRSGACCVGIDDAECR